MQSEALNKGSMFDINVVLIISARDDEDSEKIRSYLVKHEHKFTKEDEWNFKFEITDKKTANALIYDLKHVGCVIFLGLLNGEAIT